MNAPTVAGTAASARPASLSAAHTRRIVISSSIGNALEWYDFLVYGFFASIIGKLFFPADDEWVSLLFAVGSFGVSFLTRPVGAIVLGMYADRKGRKAALTLSILLMIVGTLTIAVMPTYQQIGIVAPITILLARLVQGFAVGGEFGSATAFMVEHSARGRGYYASWQFASQGLAAILASGFGALLTAALFPSELESWGWRLPFIFGLLVGPVGFYIRRHLDETPEFVAEQKKTTVDPQASFKAQWTNLLLAVGVVAQSTVSVYVLQLYMPTYAVKQLHLPAAQSFAVVVLNGGLQFLLSPVMGALSDRIGRRPLLLVFTVLTILTAYPAMTWLVGDATFGKMLVVELWLSFLYASYNGAMVVALTEVMPVDVRTAGFSLAYSLATAVFGGFTPAIATGLIEITHDKAAPGLWMSFAAVCGLIATLVLYRRKSLAVPLAA